MRILYNIGVRLYFLIILLASLFNKKAKYWINGRKNILDRIEAAIGNDKDIIWFHASSLGEFEQGRPVLERIKSNFPSYKILLTFYSPSGYEVRKNYENADYILYLPLDTKKNAKRLISIVNPKMVFWVKYDLWYYILKELKEVNIPVYLISSIFRKDQIFFKSQGKLALEMIKCFSHIFVQNQESKELLANIDINNVTIAGDTRFDRVSDIAKNAKSFPLAESFKGNNKLFIAGSSWQPDEELIIKYINTDNSDLKFIIAPHVVSKDNVNRIVNSINPKVVKYSEADENNLKSAKVLIIDNIGILSGLYRYADISYVGGGFGVSIHNTQEPAIWGLPILVGPNYKKFQEAVDLVKLKGMFSINSYDEFKAKLSNLFNNDELRNKTSQISKDYMESKIGATGIIYNKLF